MKVLLSTNIPAPYMVDYLEELGKKCDLTVLFEMEGAKDREKQWYGKIKNKPFKSVFLNAVPFSAESGLSFKIIKYLKEDFDRIIIANPTTPTGVVALLYCRMKKIHFIIQSEGGFRGTGKGIKEKIKRFLMEKADFYLSGMKGEKDYFLSYGATEDTLRWYPFSSLKKDKIDKKPISLEEKKVLKDELNIFQEQVVLCVGRAIPSKGFDILLNAKKSLSDDVGLYFIGGRPTEEYLKIIKTNGLKNVHFIEHCDYLKLQKYYRSADVFVMPTRCDTWGLVINEAMANGLPVITTDRCIAGLQLIENGVNGYIVQAEDSETLGKYISDLLGDDELRHEMAKNNLRKIEDYSIENMAAVIFEHISE